MAASYEVEVLCTGPGGARRFEARAIFHPEGVRLEGSAGETLAAGYGGAQLGRGGASNERAVLTLTGPEQAVVRLLFRDATVLRRPPGAWPDGLRAEAERQGRAGRWGWLAAGAVVALTAALWFGTGPALEAAVGLVPPRLEVPVGRVFADAAAREGLVTDPVITDAVEAIGGALTAPTAATEPWRFRFRVIRAEAPNAFAFPGGEVLVTSGLIALAETPDELAGVLGHEIQHVRRRHTTRRLLRALGWQLGLAMVIGDPTTLGALAAAQGSALLELSFGRDQEREADHGGMIAARTAGFRPEAYATFFGRMEGAAPNGGPVWLSSHPGHEERADTARAEARALTGPTRPRPALPAWDEVRSRAMRCHAARH